MKVVQLYKSGQNHMTLKINTVKLEAIQKALGIKYRTEVGILGASEHNRKQIGPRMASERNAKGLAKPSKTDASTLTNAQIGTIHEFGSVSRGIPARSFLWMPLSLHLMDEVNKKASVINNHLNMADIFKCYQLLGIIAENVVQEAFETGGFGHWQKLKAATIARKGGSEAILIDTAQLRKSITSRVVA
jgi:phage gpG-like protein